MHVVRSHATLFFRGQRKAHPASAAPLLFSGHLWSASLLRWKDGSAVLQLFTLGGLGIWAFIDMIMIIVGAFSDAEGSKITEWT